MQHVLLKDLGLLQKIIQTRGAWGAKLNRKTHYPHSSQLFNTKRCLLGLISHLLPTIATYGIVLLAKVLTTSRNQSSRF